MSGAEKGTPRATPGPPRPIFNIFSDMFPQIPGGFGPGAKKVNLFIKTKVVELEILYNSGVNGAPDHLSNDGLYSKYFLT